MKQYYLKTATWIFLLLFLVGCQQTVGIPNLEHTLQCHVKITRNDVEYQAEFNSPVLGRYEFLVSSPSSLNGLKVVLENGMVSYNFEGVSHKKEQGTPLSLLEQMAGIWELAVRGEGVIWERTSNQWIGKGTYQENPFTIACDKQTNRPVSIAVQDGLTIEFIYE